MRSSRAAAAEEAPVERLRCAGSACLVIAIPLALFDSCCAVTLSSGHSVVLITSFGHAVVEMCIVAILMWGMPHQSWSSFSDTCPTTSLMLV